ncbi:MAG: ABC transporter ATP-binding protein [Rubrivivax sp.]|nr:ABC transporter ATP-binding protein [Rubrivivax sp.]
MSFLVLDRLTKRYDASVAVDSLSLAVERGEFIALLGPSGCGKTTTLQMIAGFVEPTSGSIQLGGKDLTRVKPAQRGLGIVFQSYALFPHMTAAENVAFGLQMQRLGAAEIRRRVDEVLQLVGLGGLADRYPRRMSGGQQQRVALARALVIKPQILLLDEPLSNLDAKLREGMQIELRQIQRTLGTTTVLVTHDQGEAMALADRIVVMNRGRAEQVGAPHQTYEWPATPFVAEFLGKTNLLAGSVDAATLRLEIAGECWALAADQCQALAPTDAPAAGDAPAAPLPVHVTVRPEKIRLLPAGMDRDQPGIDGRVRTRIFQGNHWLVQADALGQTLTVIAQNSGRPVPAEGEPVRLTWAASDLRLRPATAALA